MDTILIVESGSIKTGSADAYGVVAPRMGEAHRRPTPVMGPQRLDQPVVELPRPLAHQQGLHLFGRDDVLGAYR